LRELVDVLLEGKVDVAAAVGDEALLLDDADALARHALAQPRSISGCLKWKKCPE
jgi:hypothetical protein